MVLSSRFFPDNACLQTLNEKFQSQHEEWGLGRERNKIKNKAVKLQSHKKELEGPKLDP